MYRDVPVCIPSMCGLVRFSSPSSAIVDSTDVIPFRIPAHSFRALFYTYSFVRTNQTQVLDAPDLNSVVDGMRKICAIESTLLGGVASANGELPSTAVLTPTPTPTSNSGSSSRSILLKESGVLPKSLYLVMTVAVGGVVGGLVL